VASGNVQDISAAPRATGGGGGSAYLLYNDGTLYRHEGFVAPYDSWTKVADGVTQMSASDNLPGGAVFAVGTDGGLTEYWWATDGAHQQHLADNVRSASAVMPYGVKADDTGFTMDNVFVEFNDGSLTELTGGAQAGPLPEYLAPAGAPVGTTEKLVELTGRTPPVAGQAPQAPAAAPEAPAPSAPAAAGNTQDSIVQKLVPHGRHAHHTHHAARHPHGGPRHGHRR
jgi:hypothetical protein